MQMLHVLRNGGSTFYTQKSCEILNGRAHTPCLAHNTISLTPINPNNPNLYCDFNNFRTFKIGFMSLKPTPRDRSFKQSNIYKNPKSVKDVTTISKDQS